jgi:hypothetical protein
MTESYSANLLDSNNNQPDNKEKTDANSKKDKGIEAKQKKTYERIDVLGLDAKKRKADIMRANWMSIYLPVAQYITRTPQDIQATQMLKGYKNVNLQRVYTSFCKLCTRQFVNVLQNNITPIMQKWLYVKEIDDKNELVEGDNTEFNSVIDKCKNESNFDINIDGFYKDLLYGTACLHIGNDPIKKNFYIETIAFCDYSFYTDFKDDITHIFRSFKLKKAEILTQYGHLDGFIADAFQDNVIYELVEAVVLNEQNKWDLILYKSSEERIDPKQGESIAADISQSPFNGQQPIDVKDIIFVSAEPYEYCPYCIVRWNKKKKEHYGTGVGLEVLDSFRILNKLYETVSTIISYQVPTFMVENQGLMNARMGITPGALISVKSNSREAPSVMPLTIDSSSLQPVYMYIQDLKQEISSMMYAKVMNGLSQPNTTTGNVTATQINALIAEDDADKYPTLVKTQLQMKYLPYRIVEVLQDLKYLKKLNIPELNKKGGVIEISNPMTIFFKKNINKIFETLQIVSAIDPNMVVIDKVKLTSDIVSNTVNNNCIRSYDQALQYLQQLQEQQAQGGQ